MTVQAPAALFGAGEAGVQAAPGDADIGAGSVQQALAPEPAELAVTGAVGFGPEVLGYAAPPRR